MVCRDLTTCQQMEIWQPVYWPQGKYLSRLHMTCSAELASRQAAAAAPAFCVYTNPIVSQGCSQPRSTPCARLAPESTILNFTAAHDAHFCIHHDTTLYTAVAAAAVAAIVEPILVQVRRYMLCCGHRHQQRPGGDVCGSRRHETHMGSRLSCLPH